MISDEVSRRSLLAVGAMAALPVPVAAGEGGKKKKRKAKPPLATAVVRATSVGATGREFVVILEFVVADLRPDPEPSRSFANSTAEVPVGTPEQVQEAVVGIVRLIASNYFSNLPQDRVAVMFV